MSDTTAPPRHAPGGPRGRPAPRPRGPLARRGRPRRTRACTRCGCTGWRTGCGSSPACGCPRGWSPSSRGRSPASRSTPAPGSAGGCSSTTAWASSSARPPRWATTWCCSTARPSAASPCGTASGTRRSATGSSSARAPRSSVPSGSGPGAQIGANAVVIHDVPAGAIAVGVPAQIRLRPDGRPVRRRDRRPGDLHLTHVAADPKSPAEPRGSSSARATCSSCTLTTRLRRMLLRDRPHLHRAAVRPAGRAGARRRRARRAGASASACPARASSPPRSTSTCTPCCAPTRSCATRG